MIHRYLRAKITAIIAISSIIMAGSMWVFNTFFSVRDVSLVTRGLPVFIVTVLTLTSFMGLIISRYLHSLKVCLKRIEEGEQLPLDERIKARQLIVRLPLFIIAINILGFFMGPTVNIIILNIRSNIGSLISDKDLLIIYYNITIGIVSAWAQIILCNIVLTKPKQLLKIESFTAIKGKTKKDMSLFLKNIVVPFCITLLLSSLLFTAGIKLYEEVINLPITIYEKISKNEPLTPVQKEDLAELTRQLPLQVTLIAAISENNISEEKIRSKQVTDAFAELKAIVKQKESQVFTNFLLMFVIILFVAAVFLIFYSQEQKALLIQIKLKMEEIVKGKGDLTQRLSIIHFDEMGELVSFINLFYDYLHNLIIKVKIASQEVTNSSASLMGFMQKISLFINDINSLTDVVIQNTSTQQGIVNKTKEAIETLRLASDQISCNVETQASFIEENSASVTEMTSNINSVNSIVKNANNLSEKLLIALKEGEDKIQNTIETIRNIETSSNEVNEIVSIISDIATQTNLLSMNASIEAAHAGEVGKGFAVVAEEVRKLSDDSAEKADNIITHIESMNGYIENGVSISEGTEYALLQIKNDVVATTDLLNTIYNAMQEQSAGTEEIIVSTRSVVDATVNIKELTSTQNEHSEQIQLLMEEIIRSEEEVKKNIENQTERYKEFTVSLDKIKETLKKNNEVTQNLDQMLNQFKV